MDEACVSLAWECCKEKPGAFSFFRAGFNLLIADFSGGLPGLLSDGLARYPRPPGSAQLPLGLILATLIPTTVVGICTVHLLLMDFIAPIMVLRISCHGRLAGFPFGDHARTNHAPDLVLAAMRFVLSLLVGVLTTLGCCCTSWHRPFALPQLHRLARPCLF